MNEKPIIFSGPMIRAILDGTKTQTRRIAKLNASGRVKEVGSPRNWHCGDPNAIEACPFGKVGSHLWVRESFQYESTTGEYEFDLKKCIVRYKATEPDAGPWMNAEDEESYAWRPSIHLPRWASRITLEVVRVRLERLQGITEEDAIAEGIDEDGEEYAEGERLQSAGSPQSPFRYAFVSLWNSINGKRGFSWAANPYVWALTFKRLQ